MPLPRATRARAAIAAVFFVNGCGLGLWAGHIAVVRRGLGLSESELGVALLAMAAGAIALMPAMGWLAHRFGSDRCTRLAGVLFAVGLVLPVAAPSWAALILATFVLGAANGALDVAQSTNAAAVERALARPVMSSLNGFFSLGGVAGAGLASLLLALGRPPLLGLLAASLALAAVIALAGPALLVDRATPGEDGGHHFRRPSGAALGLGLLALLGVLSEWAMLDWSGVYLADVLAASSSVAPLGFAAFAAAMTIGRFTGDGAVRRLGAQRLFLLSNVLAALGVVLVVTAPTPHAALPGFAIAGLGIANIFPLVISGAARLPGIVPSVAVAAVATLAYAGGLLGPVLIGFGAEAFGLRLALAGLLAAPLALLAAGVGGWVRLAPVPARAGTA